MCKRRKPAKSKLPPHVWVWKCQSPFPSRGITRFFFKEDFDPSTPEANTLYQTLLDTASVFNVGLYQSYISVHWTPGNDRDQQASDLVDIGLAQLLRYFGWDAPVRAEYLEGEQGLWELRMREYPDGSRWQLGV